MEQRTSAQENPDNHSSTVSSVNNKHCYALAFWRRFQGPQPDHLTSERLVGSGLLHFRGRLFGPPPLPESPVPTRASFTACAAETNTSCGPGSAVPLAPASRPATGPRFLAVRSWVHFSHCESRYSRLSPPNSPSPTQLHTHFHIFFLALYGALGFPIVVLLSSIS